MTEKNDAKAVTPVATPEPAAPKTDPTPAVPASPASTASPADKLKTAGHRFKEKASKDGKINPVLIGVIAAVLVIIIALVLFFTVFNGNFAKGDIRSVDFYQSKSTKEVQDQTVKAAGSFKSGEPILVKISYGISDNAFTQKPAPSEADANTENADGAEVPATPTDVEDAQTTSVTFTYEIYKDKNTDSPVRRGSLPITATKDTKDGDRYISVVSSARTALEVGNYTLEVRSTSEDGSLGEIVAKKTFKVTD